MKIWRLVHGVWEERNKDRHGETEEEQAEKKIERLLREVKMWYNHRENDDLLLEGDEKEIFHDTFEQHKEKEGTVAKVQNWLATFGRELLESKLGATKLRRRALRGPWIIWVCICIIR